MKKWKKGIMGVLLFAVCSMSVCAEELNDTDQVSQVQNLDFEHFLTDLSAVLKTRYEAVSNKKFDSDSSRMTAMQQAASEWESMGKYDAVSFAESADSNEEYIRSSYLEGLDKQNSLNAGMSNDDFWQTWDEGYELRKNVLVELQRVYSNQIDAEAFDAYIVLGESKNYAENYTLEAWQLQALVYAYHEREGIDGQPGKMTVLMLKQMQEELEIQINGVVNETRIEELVDALQRKGKSDVIEAANKKLEMGGVHDAQGNPYENPTISIASASAGVDVQNETEHTVITGETELQEE